MAKEKETKEKKPAEKPEKKGGAFKWFVIGGLLGLAVGVIVGWMIRPPDSFDADELRAATEKKFIEAKDSSREKLADFAEDLAKRLREEQK